MSQLKFASKTRDLVVWLVLLLLLAASVLYNQPEYPRTWYDEGWHTLAARILAERGVYAYGPSLGPMVLVPVAFALKLWGVGLVQARWVIAAYFLLTICLYGKLARRYAGHGAEYIAVILWIAVPSVDALVFGRNVMGEVPAAAWMLLGCLIWTSHAAGKVGGQAALTGVCWALAVLSKNQFALIYPVLACMVVLDRLYYRCRPLRAYLVSMSVSLVLVAGWYALQITFPYGGQLTAHNIQQWTSAPSRGLFAFSPNLTLHNLAILTSSLGYYGVLIVGLGAAASRVSQRTLRGYTAALLGLMTLAWLSWFTLASVGWDRYLFPALLVAVLLASDAILRCARWAWANRSGPNRQQRDRARVTLVLIVLLVLITTRWVVRLSYPILHSNDQEPQHFAARLLDLAGPDAQIETWDPEVGFLTGLNLHSPPSELFDAIVRARWYGDKWPSGYDWLSSRPEYLVVGSFGRWAGIYQPEVIQACTDPLLDDWGYALYRVDANKPSCFMFVAPQ